MNVTIALVGFVFFTLGALIGSLSSKFLERQSFYDSVGDAIRRSGNRGLCVSVSMFPHEDGADGDDGDGQSTIPVDGPMASYRNN